ncbi:nucleotidyltransferase family protein [Nostocaceae cyanobacterium CENA357]|uniref:Nucleotidyltransferase family protein n=1 Tax=Atlanticothrix silvestris CENA357 TaxID=1725252 RepID=A0A8J7HCQ4_9CYAN|nr:nucleotidyltransferase family protein [Atlanticothrix silvestris]MBH8550890.1 nucleotidyltransferase family protein [Atlanticothrix silvestris CENA357]
MNNNNIRLQSILVNTVIGNVLPAIAQLNLPNWWLAGGAVRNTVWHSIFGQECGLFVKDFDIAFFDEAGNRSQELAAKTSLTEQFPGEKFDVKNQASFARWRSGSRPYMSTEDGITDWLHTATAVGVKLDLQGQWQFFTPYGFDDLFNGIIRSTPAHIHNPDAHKKASEFLSKCPYLLYVHSFAEDKNN